MERDIEKDLMEIEHLIKEHEKRDNTFTMSVLQRCYELVTELMEYRNLEEQGLLPQLPCSIGSDVYFIPSKVVFELNKLNGHEENNRVYHQKVSKIVFTERGWYLECDQDLEYGTDHILVDKLYKETWFLSQAKAEEALKRKENDNG